MSITWQPERPVGPHAIGVVAREIAGCFAVLKADGAEAFLLNDTASDVWRLLESQSTFEVVVGLLAHAYAVDPRRICDDVATTIDFLERNGLCISP